MLLSVDALGYRTTVAYDLAGQPVARQDALGYRMPLAYDAAGRPFSLADPLGRRVTLSYDRAGQPVAGVDPLGYRMTVAYDAAGQVVAAQGARGNVTTGVYDADGRLQAIVSPLGYRASYAYDAANRLVGVQDALGHRYTGVYDASGLQLAAVDPLGFTRTLAYDALARPVAAEDALGNRTTVAYDPAGWVQSVQDARGYLTSFGYDAAGQPIALVNARGAINTTVYDARGAVLCAQDPLGALTSFQYDAVGGPALRIDARGWVTTYTDDALGRNTGVLYQSAKRVTFTFDAAGQLETMQDWTGVTAYAYDLAGRQVSVANPNGKTLTYSFDEAGNRVGMVDPDGGLTTYAYDAQSRPTGILNPWAEMTTITWDALDREWVKTLGNGMVHEHTYDAAGRQTLLRNVGPAGNALAAYTGTYDAEGNLLFIHELDGTRVTFAYDPLYQLVGEERSGEYAYCTSYSYDPVGNRLVKVDGGLLTTYTYNIADELLTVTLPTGEVTTSTWDGNGNLASEEAEAGQTAYAWDDENRLVRITSPGGSIDTFTYAADGLRRRKEPGSTARNFVWDGLNVLQELDATFSTAAEYTGYPGVPGGLASMRRSGASSFYGFDLLGNTRLLASMGGNVTDAYAYKAFGEELPAVGATDNPFRFGGMPGYYRQGAEPVYGRWWHLNVAQGRMLGRTASGATGASLYVFASAASALAAGGGPRPVIPPVSGAEQEKVRWVFDQITAHPRPSPPAPPPPAPLPPAPPPPAPLPPNGVRLWGPFGGNVVATTGNLLYILNPRPTTSQNWWGLARGAASMGTGAAGLGLAGAAVPVIVPVMGGAAVATGGIALFLSVKNLWEPVANRWIGPHIDALFPNEIPAHPPATRPVREPSDPPWCPLGGG